jgi:hypothetical protein
MSDPQPNKFEINLVDEWRVSERDQPWITDDRNEHDDYKRQ